MPLYDLICRTCGKEFETLVMGSDTPSCPFCGSADLAKQMSTFATRTGGGGKASSAGSGSKCGGCSGGSCKTCH